MWLHIHARIKVPVLVKGALELRSLSLKAIDMAVNQTASDDSDYEGPQSYE